MLQIVSQSPLMLQVQGMRADGAAMSSPSILKEATRIFREEGFRAFWKGNGVTIVHRLPYSSINFFAYEQYKMVSYLFIIHVMKTGCIKY